MKKFTLIFFLLFYTIILKAQQQVSINEIRNAALQTYRVNYQDYTKSLLSINSVNVKTNQNNDTLLYEVIFDDNYAILLSGSKSCLPILAYYPLFNNQSIFDIISIPEGLQCIIQEYYNEIDTCFSIDTLSLRYVNEWNSLQNINLQKSSPNIVIAPLITTKWNQSSSNDGHSNSYNYYCEPCPSNPSVNYPAGCVAVAMAQIMNYWKYPLNFDWCNMPDELNYYGIPLYNPKFEIQRNAIAYLLKDCGDKVDMDYGCSGSGAWVFHITQPCAIGALEDDYGFSSDANYKRKFWHTTNNWIAQIKENLDNGYPILYRGQNSDGGAHAFVCDGYRSDNTFHFNWGWGNNQNNNNWFTLSNLSNSNYNSKQGAIFNIHPPSNYTHYCDWEVDLTTLYQFYNTFFPDNYSYYTIVPRVPQVLYSAAEEINGVPTPETFRTIPAGATVEYVAHDEIVLLPGFTAEAGSNFVARIEPCSNCNENQAKSTKINQSTNEDTDNSTNISKEEKQQSPIPNRQSEIKIYPNPNDGSFTIDVSDNSEIQNIKIYDLSGKMIFEQNGNSKNISPTNLKKGVYSVEIKLNNQKFVEKIIVE